MDDVNVLEEIAKLENKIKEQITLFETRANCSVALIDYKSYLYDASTDSLCSTLARQVSVSIKRKVG